MRSPFHEMREHRTYAARRPPCDDRSRRWMRRCAPVIVALAAVGCSALPPLPPGTCGNGVIEPASGEDCDGPTDTLCGAASDPLRACRRLCDAASATPCPSGTGCGNDGVCRAASLAFRLRSSRPWVSAETLIADVNGDGFDDAIGVTDQRVDLALASGDGDLAPTTTLPGQSVSGAPAIGDPNGDGLPDVVIPTPIGVVTMAGDPADGLVPVAQSSIPIDVGGRLIYGLVIVGPASSLLAMATLTPTRGALYNDFDGDPTTPPQVLPFPADHAIDDVIGTQLQLSRRSGPTGGPEGLLTVVFADQVWLLKVVGGITAVDEIDVSEIGSVFLDTTTPQCGRIQWASMIAHTNDNLLDLVVTTAPAGAGALARNCIQALPGAAVVDSPPPGRLRGFAGDRLSTIWSELASATDAAAPLAVGSADHVFVGPGLTVGVSVVAGRRSIGGLRCADGVGALCSFEFGRSHSHEWDRALLADLDGRPGDDVLGYKAGDPTVDVFLRSTFDGGVVFNSAAVTTPGPVRDVLVGEFDGDHIPDAAIVVGGNVGEQSAGDHAVYVAYGRQSAAPGPAVLMAKLGTVAGATIVNLPIGRDLDGLDDLLVIAERGVAGDPPTRGGAVLLGSTSRRMVAPLLLPEDDPPFVPFAVAPMSLDERNGEDLLLVASSGSDSFLLPYSPNGFTMELLSAAPAPFIPNFNASAALWTSVQRIGAARIGAAADPEGKVVSVSISCGATCNGMPTATTLSTGMNLPPPASLRATDIDGDGDLDLVGVFDTRLTATAEIVIWSNDASSLTPTPSQVFDLSAHAYDAVAADLDRDGQPELLIATRGGILMSKRTGGAWTVPEPLIPRGDGELPPVLLDATDLDRDGLLDLLIGTGTDRRHPTSLELWQQIELGAGVETAR